MSMAGLQFHFKERPIVVVMGVRGCGKSTNGAALAKRLVLLFLDDDDCHRYQCRPNANDTAHRLRCGPGCHPDLQYTGFQCGPVGDDQGYPASQRFNCLGIAG